MLKAEIFTLPRTGNIHDALTSLSGPLTFFDPGRYALRMLGFVGFGRSPKSLHQDRT